MLDTILSVFRKNLEKYLAKVSQDFDTLIINRGKNTVVVVFPFGEYNSLKATQHALLSRTNEKRLDAAIE